MKKDYCIKTIIFSFFCILFLTVFAEVEKTVADSNATIEISVNADIIALVLSDSLESKPDSVISKASSPKKAGNIIPSNVLKETTNKLKVSKLFLSLFSFIIGWFFIKYSTSILNIFSERWTKHRLAIKSIIPVFRTISWTFIIKPPIQSIITITASAGIAIGFASQDILKNIFGGIVILLDKPFRVGDKIQMEGHYGEVIGIGLRTVRVLTPDDSIVSIPNSEMVSKSVSNANSGEPDCQVVAEFFFPPEINLDKAHTLAIKCASLSRYIYLNKPIAVVFKNEMFMGKSMIKMRLKAYVYDHRFEFPFITDMSKIVLKEFEKAGLINQKNE
jgi:small-conductance mechanosensitive channel